MPYGRGGAGNIQAVEQQVTRSAADIEASAGTAPSAGTGAPSTKPVAAADLQSTLPASIHDQQYAHSGRGGAGNYYSPKELTTKGHFSDAHRSHILGDGTLAPSAKDVKEDASGAPPSYNTAQTKEQPSRGYGRGGAGNYSFGVPEDEAKMASKKMEGERIGEKIKEDTEKGVEEALAMPEKAKLPHESPKDVL